MSEAGQAGHGVMRRYERKFLVPRELRHRIAACIRTCPGLFRVSYPQRQVNSLYLDTRDMDDYRESVEGIGARRKLRIRWYGAPGGAIARPRLEIKSKQGLAGEKQVFDLPPFTLGPDTRASAVSAWLAGAGLPDPVRFQLARRVPVVATRYRRSYWESADRRWRLTVDVALQYRGVASVRGNHRQVVRDDDVVMEAKYAGGDDIQAARLLQHFPLRVTRKSKYVSAVDALWPQPGAA